MIKMSTKSTYAVKALVQLALEAQTGPVRLSALAEAQNIPLPYLEQIFSKLRKAGLVEAVRGPQGGYKLSKNPDNITVFDIVTILEGPISPVMCSMPENRTPDCHDVDGCVSRVLCNELDGALFTVLSKNTLASLCGEAARLANVRQGA